MIIKLIGTESLGVRGLSCSIELNRRKIFIDPGIALGWSRHGFLPHPFQIALGAEIKRKIIEELKSATDIIFSHFDGDHCPLLYPNPYQMGIHDVENSLADCRIWAIGPEHSPPTQQKRRKDLAEIIKKDIPHAQGLKAGPLTFSLPVPHGEQGREANCVMMTKIEEDGTTFVHASDIQLLDEQTIEKISDWKPDIVFVSGPPLYRYSASSFQKQRENAWKNAVRLSQKVGTLVIEHHLLRSMEGFEWLEKLKYAAKNKVCCAADFMSRDPLFLEAWREELYKWLPASENWHEGYQQGKVDTQPYRISGWKVLIAAGKIKPCKWYDACSIKTYTDKGLLERYWVENYCLVSNRQCIRYQMVEEGQYHPDNMLPDGEIREYL